MNRLFMLNYLDNKFINSPLKTKIELYLLPLFFIYLSYFISQTAINDNPIIQSNNQINVSKEMEPLNPVLSSNQNANNIELTVNQNKSEDKIRVTKIMIFYSDSTFEEFTKN